MNLTVKPMIYVKKKYDRAYTAAKSMSGKHKAYIEMLDTRSVSGTKYQLALSAKQKKLINKLFYA